MVAILLAEDESCCVVTSNASTWQHDLPAPVHEVTVFSPCTKLLWSAASWQHAKVNEYASLAAGQLVKGDAFLVSPNKKICELSQLLRSARSLRPIHQALRPWTRQHPLPCWCQSLKCTARCHNIPIATTATQSSSTNSNDSVASAQNNELAVDQAGSTCTSRDLNCETTAESANNTISIPQAGRTAHTASNRLQQTDRTVDQPSTQHLSLHSQRHYAPWQDLPSGILTQICLLLPCQASSVLAMMQVCKSWRTALLSDNQILANTWFSLNPFQPLKTGPSATTPPHTKPAQYVRRMLPLRGRTSSERSEYGSSITFEGELNDHLSNSADHSEDDSDDEAAVDSWAVAMMLGLSGTTGMHDMDRLPPRMRAQHIAHAAAHMRTLLPHVPSLVQAAVKRNNCSAMGCMAQLLEVCGKEDEALRLWKKCAKAGDTEACLRLGIASYSGAPGCPMDSEAAQMWLSKGLKALLGINSLAQFSVDMHCSRVTLPTSAVGFIKDAASSHNNETLANTSDAARQSNQPFDQPANQTVSINLQELWALRAAHQQSRSLKDSQTETNAFSDAAQCSRSVHVRPSRHSSIVPSVDYQDPHLASIVARTAMMLAYMYFDGEAGLKTDKQQACTLFKLAALCGSREAARALTWMYSTGQYGS